MNPCFLRLQANALEAKADGLFATDPGEARRLWDKVIDLRTEANAMENESRVSFRDDDGAKRCRCRD